MNKRQFKKQCTKATERMNVFNRLTWYCGRRCGKTFLIKQILDVCYSKKYKPYKELKRQLEDVKK